MPADKPAGQSIDEQIANLKKAIALQESLRPSLGEAIVETTLQVLRAELAQLEKQAALAPQRKQVTVLFADLQGFTALTEKMDIEEVRNLVGAIWERLDGIILAHGGRIDKHIGDGVMALWGVDASREDDPERALRAALAMQQELAALSARLFIPAGGGSQAQTAGSAGLQMRIGMHSGPVLLGEVGANREFTALGDTVNTANRLESAAPADQVLISHSLYQRVQGIFDCQPTPTLQLRGKSRPLRAYLVNGLRPRVFWGNKRGVEGVETHMVGRQAELERLQSAFQQVAEQRQEQFITILAEAGLGKSRLLYEFLLWLDGQRQANIKNQPRVYKGRADEEMQHIPNAVVWDVVTNAFNILENDPPAVIQQKLQTGIAEILQERPATDLHPGIDAAGIEMRARVVGRLLGFDLAEATAGTEADPGAEAAPSSDPRQARNRAMGYIAEYLQAAASQQPVVLMLDDIHWADDSSLDILLYLGQLLANQPILIVCAARPILYERLPLWDEALTFSQRMELNPLSPQDSLALVDEILQKLQDRPAELREMVVKNAEGNPFYVEELVKMLIDDGVIQVGEESESDETHPWRINPDRLAVLRLPATLAGILQARFDSLPLEERLVLQHASVVGRTFWDQALNYISKRAANIEQPGGQAARSQPVEQAIREALASLHSREMIFPHPASVFESSREYTFKHALLRDAVYQGILKRQRRDYHALVAEWLIQQGSGRTSEIIGLIADHLEQAERTEQALAYLRQAGEQAAVQFANLEAIQYFTRALNILPATDIHTRLELLLLRENIFALQANRPAQEKDQAEMQQLAEELGEDCWRAEVLLRRARYAQQTSNYATAITWARQAARLARACASPYVRAAAHLEQGRALYRQASYVEATVQLEQALLLAEEQPIIAADILQTLVIVSLHQGRQVASQRYLEQALQIVRQSGDRQTEGNVLASVGSTLNDRGNYAQAQHYLNQALAVFKEIGDRHGQAISLQQLGLATDKQHHYEKARTYYLQAQAIYHATGDRLGMAWMSDAIGSLLQYQGQPMQAVPHFEEALALYHSIGVPWGEAISLHNLGFAYMTVGQFETAGQNLKQALVVCQAAGDRWGTIWRMSYLGLLAHQLEDNQTALTLTAEALRIAREFGARHEQAMVLTHHAHALTGLGQWEQAQAAYEQALVMRRQLGESSLALETLAGMARLSLVRSDTEQALADIEHILTALAQPGALEGADEPGRIYLTCWKVLQAAGDPRASQARAAGQAWLAECARQINDPAIRESFLKNIPAHRELQEA